jgi:hypothetical protein
MVCGNSQYIAIEAPVDSLIWRSLSINARGVLIYFVGLLAKTQLNIAAFCYSLEWVDRIIEGTNLEFFDLCLGRSKSLSQGTRS